jgi:hypothetical protein
MMRTGAAPRNDSEADARRRVTNARCGATSDERRGARTPLIGRRPIQIERRQDP